MNNRRKFFLLLWTAPFAAFSGLLALWSVSNSPRFEAFHALDAIRLMTAGAGFATALMLLIQFFIRSGPGSEDK
jgi:hypothetical protein